jgi:hypothetical protein
MEIDFSKDILAAKKGKAPLNKPFRLPSGSKKKFGVYVKNDKGNIVKVTFGDPNMSIKRDNPERRKAYRARHGCDNPGPKYKANYWSCKMWSAKPVSKITGSEEEIILEAEVQGKNKGLWYNIQQKKKRMGKNYRPAKPGSPDRPTEEALKKAQGSDYLNEEYEWDGETEFDQNQLTQEDPTLNEVETMDDRDMEAHEMSEGQLSAIADKAEKLLEAMSDHEVVDDMLEPWVQNKLAIIDDYMSTIYDYIMYPSTEEETQDQQNPNLNQASSMFQVGDKVRNINAMCKHYGSEGTVKEIRNLPEDMGYAVMYECTNDGSTWKKGDMLGKTEIQLQKISEAKWSKEYKDSIDCKNPKGFSQKQHCKSKASSDEQYQIEADEEYKKMTTIEAQKFNEFLKKCFPTKKGDDKSKFKSCLEDYKKNK